MTRESIALLERFVKDAREVVDLVGAMGDRIEQLEESLGELANPAKAKLVDISDGGISIQSPVFAVLLEGMIQILDGLGAENYVECDIGSGAQAVTMTIRRKHGKTPHDLRKEAEAEVSRLKELLESGKGGS